MAQTHITALRGSAQTIRTGSTPPTDPSPGSGDVYYDTTKNMIGRYDGSKWVYSPEFTTTSTSSSTTTSTSTTE